MWGFEKIKENFLNIEAKIKNYKKRKKLTQKGISQKINDFIHKQYRSLFFWRFDEIKYKV